MEIFENNNGHIKTFVFNVRYNRQLNNNLKAGRLFFVKNFVSE